MDAAGPEMTARLATRNDAVLLFSWRNDAVTRQASVNSAAVAWDQHIAWLEQVLANRKQSLFIVETSSPVGTVRIDHGEEIVLSWTVAPAARGLGFGKAMVTMLCPPGHVVAYIKHDNIGSQHIARAAGFKLALSGDLQRWERQQA